MLVFSASTLEGGDIRLTPQSDVHVLSAATVRLPAEVGGLESYFIGGPITIQAASVADVLAGELVEEQRKWDHGNSYTTGVSSYFDVEIEYSYSYFAEKFNRVDVYRIAYRVTDEDGRGPSGPTVALVGAAFDHIGRLSSPAP